MQLALVTETLLLSSGKVKTGHPLISTVEPAGVSGQLSSAFRIPSPSESSLTKVMVISTLAVLLSLKPSLTLKLKLSLVAVSELDK